MTTRPALLLRLFVIGFLLFSLSGAGTASAQACGGNGQKACSAFKSGPVCNTGLGSFDKICKPCGRANQMACPVLTAGPQCFDGAINQNNHCIPCGSNGQRACPVVQSGPICQPGLGNINSKCQPCGRLNQLACPVLEQGRQCQEWTTQRDGKCRPCGDVDAAACQITDQGPACKPGLNRDLLSGNCTADTKELVRRAALEHLESLVVDLGPMIETAIARNSDDGYKDRMRDEDAAVLAAAPHSQNRTFRTWTIGVGAEAKAVLGLGGEIGAALPVGSPATGGKLFKWYASGGMTFQLGAGGSGSVTVGFWRADYDKQRGPTHGVVFDLKQIGTMAFKGAQAYTKLAEGFKKTGVTIALGVWFDPSTGPVGSLQGFTVTVGGGRGADLTGVTYYKGITTQVCSVEMQCPVGRWSGRIGGRGASMSVVSQGDDYVDVNVGGAVRRFKRLLWSRRYDSPQGDIIRFRDNYTRIKFQASNNQTGELLLQK